MPDSMTVAIEHVCEAGAFERLLDLLIEYERSLSPELRHGGEPDLDSVLRRYREPNAAFLARLEDESVGCIALIHLDPSTAIVQRLYVKPATRRVGAGRRLVMTLLEFARERAYDRVVLDTDRTQLPEAYQLYRSLGFNDCEPYAKVDYQCATFMELKL